MLFQFRKTASSSILKARWYSTSLPNARRPLFDKVLIANRGEIACRVMKTAKRLGIKTVAVYSEADSNSMHVSMADEAYCIGPAESAKSYLNMQKIIDVAKATGAKAIHPGYGFLSENSGFADKVAASGLTFIGPPAQAIIDMGSKSASKNIMQSANVPVVPGYHGDNQDAKFLKEEAKKIGYPVMIKAVKGGGGKGMRIVRNEEEFNQMLDSARRESMKHFADDNVLIEKYIATPRHVEVQVFADTFGNTVYLFERDCSVQRRHQKILEEAPGPGITEELRKSFGEKAVLAAKAVGYVGAGTVEFILDADNQTENNFYFMEMNTRLQVEHPVTEMVTGQDLVEWQFEVASGNLLPIVEQKDIKLHGHSFEARIYAENPANNFLPDTGYLKHLKFPEQADYLRVETGIRQGDTVSVHYDPMIAKIVVNGRDRAEAARKMHHALKQCEIVGPHTNIDFLKALITHSQFLAGDVETGFISKNEQKLFDSMKHSESPISTLQAAMYLIDLEQESKNMSFSGSPWTTLSQTRLNFMETRTFKFLQGDHVVSVVLYPQGNSVYNCEVIDRNGKKHNYEGVCIKEKTPNHTVLDIKTQLVHSRVISERSAETGVIKLHVFNDEHDTRSVYEIPKPSFLVELEKTRVSHGSEHSVKSPMPSKISQVLVKPGDEVNKGDSLLILEAMKMEHVIKAPFSGTVERVNYKVGDLVQSNVLLVVFKSKEDKKSKEETN